MTAIIRYAKLLDSGDIICNIDLGGRVFMCVSKGKLSKYVLEIFPLEVSWPIDVDSDEEAIKAAKKIAKRYFKRLSSNIYQNRVKSSWRRFVKRVKQLLCVSRSSFRSTLRQVARLKT